LHLPHVAGAEVELAEGLRHCVLDTGRPLARHTGLEETKTR